jgi:hypothetical protein
VDPSVQIAMIVAVFGFVGPVIMSLVTYWVHRNETLRDYARQDEVAAKLLVSNERVAATAKTASEGTNSKLDMIHTLVNSQMTAALESELAATQRELAMMREVISLKSAAGHAPNIETLSEIKAIEGKVVELTSRLSDRFDPT